MLSYASVTVACLFGLEMKLSFPIIQIGQHTDWLLACCAEGGGAGGMPGGMPGGMGGMPDMGGASAGAGGAAGPTVEEVD